MNKVLYKNSVAGGKGLGYTITHEIGSMDLILSPCLKFTLPQIRVIPLHSTTTT